MVCCWGKIESTSLTTPFPRDTVGTARVKDLLGLSSQEQMQFSIHSVYRIAAGIPQLHGH